MALRYSSNGLILRRFVTGVGVEIGAFGLRMNGKCRGSCDPAAWVHMILVGSTPEKFVFNEKIVCISVTCQFQGLVRDSAIKCN